jgi:HAD superfamily hydrolase (TIGR01484 family)
MRFLALACDYDGTLATDGVIDEATVRALKRCRESGRKLLMVTGRELPELISICPHLKLFHRIVAENGALLYRPETGEEVLLGPPPDEQFLAILRQAEVARLSVGRVIVATWEPHETTVLNAIRDLGLELHVIFNKGAVMVLPSGINKATGLAAALKELELSPHNVAAVGDAENDHALLSSCEAGISVSNAVPTLKTRADLVTQADHGAGVAELIDRMITDDLADLESKLVRHHLLLGHDASGNEVRIAPQRRNALIVGPVGSGKSRVARALIERLIDTKYEVCIFDPEGDFGELEAAVVVGDAQQPPSPDEVLKLIQKSTKGAVVNAQAIPLADRPAFLMKQLARLHELREHLGRPHWIVVDDAHRVWPPGWTATSEVIPQNLNSTLFVTLDPSLLPPAALASIDLVVAVGKLPHRVLRAFADAANVAMPPEADADIDLGSDEALIWNLSTGNKPTIVQIQPARVHREP